MEIKSWSSSYNNNYYYFLFLICWKDSMCIFFVSFFLFISCFLDSNVVQKILLCFWFESFICNVVILIKNIYTWYILFHNYSFPFSSRYILGLNWNKVIYIIIMRSDNIYIWIHVALYFYLVLRICTINNQQINFLNFT